jgi:hypothetical protein
MRFKPISLKERILSASASALVGSVMLSTVIAGVASAEELKMTDQPQLSADQPARGMSMTKVEAKFGAPTNRVPAVGDPPITRWEYPGFVVYFEHNLVLHSVVKP